MNNGDIYNLNRFIQAQNTYFEYACKELKNGEKESHWMWFMFPQLEDLGYSSMAKFYGISSINEAKAYLENDVLKSRLNILIDILLRLECNDSVKIFGKVDSMKLCSSMTLFYLVSNDQIYKDVIDKFYNGLIDKNTEKLIKNME